MQAIKRDFEIMADDPNRDILPVRDSSLCMETCRSSIGVYSINATIKLFFLIYNLTCILIPIQTDSNVISLESIRSLLCKEYVRCLTQ